MARVNSAGGVEVRIRLSDGREYTVPAAMLISVTLSQYKGVTSVLMEFVAPEGFASAYAGGASEVQEVRELGTERPFLLRGAEDAPQQRS